MSCGCKKKRIDEAERIRQSAIKIKLTENPVSKPSETNLPDAEKIVEKLNQIYAPQLN
jgi:hypothetical protein